MFGDNVEDRIGPLKYITLYLACGIVADFAHAFATHNPDIPALGASGAISGILGGTFFYIQKSGYQFLHCSISGHIPLPCQFGFIWEYGFSVSNG
ncbi:MAG: rhomboid family intramembrane serine protease [Nitrospiraceae bacterium]|nr:MAG: rhomboid family intramembrane serine protease [Nitrospiraceae bacterium]